MKKKFKYNFKNFAILSIIPLIGILSSCKKEDINKEKEDDLNKKELSFDMTADSLRRYFILARTEPLDISEYFNNSFKFYYYSANYKNGNPTEPNSLLDSAKAVEGFLEFDKEEYARGGTEPTNKENKDKLKFYANMYIDKFNQKNR